MITSWRRVVFVVQVVDAGRRMSIVCFRSCEAAMSEPVSSASRERTNVEAKHKWWAARYGSVFEG